MSDGSYRDEEDLYNDGIETVDDILAEILNRDGSFSEDFNDRFSAYLGEDADEFSSSVSYDLSDRRDEEFSRRRVEFEDPDFRRAPQPDEYERLNRRVERKLPRSVREAYSGAEKDAQRPEFTAGGGVRYPSMGVGASSERVVFDAEWEAHAKKEAARVQRVREDRSLRGEGAYANSFVAGGRPLGRGYDEPASPYIDPLSEDDEIYSPEFSRGANDNKNPFFQSGPAVKRNNTAADGRTGERGFSAEDSGTDERVLDSFADSHEKASAAQASWMQVEEKGRKKKEKKAPREKGQKEHGKKRRGEAPEASEKREGDGGTPAPEPFYEPLSDGLTEPAGRYYPRREDDMTLTQPRRRRNAARSAKEAVEEAQTETEQLKQTVAGIVEKYNQRSEEDKLAELKALEERRIREEKLREERAKLREGLSEGLVMALDAEDLTPEQFTAYDDFSVYTEEEPVVPAPPAKRRQPARRRKTDEMYLERLDSEEEDGMTEPLPEAPEEDGEQDPAPSRKEKKQKKKKKKKKE